VRLILGITLLLLGVGLWSCQIDGRADVSAAVAGEVPWVRTIDGWERATWLATSSPPSPPLQLHPLVIAAAQLLISLLALAVYASQRSDDVSDRNRASTGGRTS
jgi:hypothetical protein